MRELGMETVSRSVQIGRHDAAVVPPELPVETLTELDPSDFGNGIRLIRRLQGAGKQAILPDRLRCKLGIDAGAAQKEQSLNIVVVRRPDQISLDNEIVPNEVGWPGIVCGNAANSG